MVSSTIFSIALVFLSTLSLRRATNEQRQKDAHYYISIHALLTESDLNQSRTSGLKFLFLSTLSLRRATIVFLHFATLKFVFLSTLSLRRATFLSISKVWEARYFYPRSPYGERPARATWQHRKNHFYPRSPYGERQDNMSISYAPQAFLSTLSLRRATPRHPKRNNIKKISIHALLTESDAYGRRITRKITLFLSTLSLRRATAETVKTSNADIFLSTLSLLRATHRTYQHGEKLTFLSTLSLRRATAGMSDKLIGSVISIHALLTESDSLTERRH